MKKFLVSSMMFLIFAVGLPLSVEAHAGCRAHRKRSYASRTYRQRSYRSYQPTYYATRGYVAERRPSFYRRHRNVINMAIGTGGGALIGGLLGGKRGAGIGALVGLGSSALYTYKLVPKRRRY